MLHEQMRLELGQRVKAGGSPILTGLKAYEPRHVVIMLPMHVQLVAQKIVGEKWNVGENTASKGTVYWLEMGFQLFAGTAS